MLYEYNRALLEQLIRIQKRSLNSYLLYTFLIFLLGAFVFVIGRIISSESISNAIDITSSFVTSLSGFSIKEIIDKRKYLELVKDIRSTIQMCPQDGQEQEKWNHVIQTLIKAMQ